MRILGIDPGLARVGYGVIDTTGGQQRMLDCGIIRTDPGHPDGERMVEIAEDLRQLIRRWRPELAAVEKFFFYRSSNTIGVVQARGVVMMTLARFKVPVVEFPPMQIKLALAGFGHAEDEVLEAVMQELNLTRSSTPRRCRRAWLTSPHRMVSTINEPWWSDHQSIDCPQAITRLNINQFNNTENPDKHLPGLIRSIHSPKQN